MTKLTDEQLNQKARNYAKENDDYHDSDGVDVEDVYKTAYRAAETAGEVEIERLKSDIIDLRNCEHDKALIQYQESELQKKEAEIARLKAELIRHELGFEKVDRDELLTLRKFRVEAMEMAGFYSIRENMINYVADTGQVVGPMERNVFLEPVGKRARAFIEKWKVVK